MGVDGRGEAFVHLGTDAHAVDRDETTELLVEVDDRHRLAFVHLEAAFDGRLGVVVALHHVAAADVADPLTVGGMFT